MSEPLSEREAELRREAEYKALADVVERVACGLWRTIYRQTLDPDWEALPDGWREKYRALVRQALAAAPASPGVSSDE